jgi:pyoverdine/dityrosine biosynthesis protein Dit1
MHTITSQILTQFDSFRQPATAIDEFEAIGKTVLAGRIDQMVSKKQPIKFAMLGFPFKSTNLRDKVLSPYPDKGEELTVKNFAAMNEKIKQVYAPGMSLSILSDGYVFNDLLNIPDEVAFEYLEISKQFGADQGAPLEWYTLKAFYNGWDINKMREKMNSQFGITEQELQYRIIYDADVNYLYRGMIKFMSEELADKNYTTSSQRQKAAKSLVRRMMLRNEAYDNMVRHIFKEHIRLSMHPSVNNGKKYSIKLIDSPYARHSAWHSAVVFDGDSVLTMHKKDAIQKGYELVSVDGQPFYFTGNN